MQEQRQRREVLEKFISRFECVVLIEDECLIDEGRILVFGRNPDTVSPELAMPADETSRISSLVDQTFIFASTLQDLLENRGYISTGTREGKRSAKKYKWLDPRTVDPELFPQPNQTVQEQRQRREVLEKFISRFECVVLIEDDPLFDVAFIKNAARRFVDCRDHKFLVDPTTQQPIEGALTAMQRKKAGEDVDIATIYTGIIPIVYKAQNQLLQSLITSIALAFVMIAIVMMILLRPWGSPFRPTNLLNLPGGALAMIPNVFPILVVFGALGHLGRKVDIGSMMTASVAMGVAVDDTIHFLNWYRQGLAKGLRRLGAIREAYERVATAMTQTTLIGGLGLSAFALSTFTPTQRFGVLMLFLLATALIGDLILLPALLASPLGRFFGREIPLDELEKKGLAPAEDENPAIRVLPRDTGGESSRPSDPDSNAPPGFDRHSGAG